MNVQKCESVKVKEKAGHKFRNLKAEIRKGFVYCAALILLSLALTAATFGASSLSSLGLGLQSDMAGVRAAGMGGTSLALEDALGLNLLVPALWDGGRTTR